jgi:hypothetical protein
MASSDRTRTSRSRTRGVAGSPAETLHYLGTSDAIVRIGGGTTPVVAARAG